MSRLSIWLFFSAGWIIGEHLGERLSVDSFQAVYVAAIVMAAHWVSNR